MCPLKSVFCAGISDILESWQAALERPVFVGCVDLHHVSTKESFKHFLYSFLKQNFLVVWLLYIQVMCFLSLYFCQNSLCSLYSFSKNHNNLIYLKYLNKLLYTCFQGPEGEQHLATLSRALPVQQTVAVARTVFARWAVQGARACPQGVLVWHSGVLPWDKKPSPKPAADELHPCHFLASELYLSGYDTYVRDVLVVRSITGLNTE